MWYEKLVKNVDVNETINTIDLVKKSDYNKKLKLLKR